MTRYFIIFALLILFLVTENIPAQNFFPYKIDDAFQEHAYYHQYDNWGFSNTTNNYPSYYITDSLIYANQVFYKYNNKYLAYDSSEQKLYIYLNGQSQLAADFNLPSDSSRILYYLGQPKIWRSGGIYYENILGAQRRVFTMYADTTYEEPIRRYDISWIVKFIEDIGPYYYYKNQYDTDLQWEWQTTITKNTLLFAKIDTTEINLYNQSIRLLDTVRNRFKDEFPYLLALDVTNPINALISPFYAEYRIFRNDSLVSIRTFDIDTSSFLGFINIQPEDLEEGDKIEFKCTLQDNSIFNNIRVIPDTGYYTFYIKPVTNTSEDYQRSIVYSLSQNYPNPFNPVTSIRYSIAHSQFVTLKVFDILGNEAATLVNEEQPKGKYSVQFDGSRLASGIYFYALRAGDFHKSRKMLLIK